jgi:hypothetical protein
MAREKRVPDRRPINTLFFPYCPCGCWRYASALAKNDPFALGKSDPHQEHDLPAGKEAASTSELLRFPVTRSFFPNQFVFPVPRGPLAPFASRANGFFRAA